MPRWETASATARYADGRLELWIASQAPNVAREAAAEAVGISPARVELYPVPAGGSFDARLEKLHAIEVAQIAKELGRPVQLTWPRGEEAKALPPRTPVAIAITAKLDPATALPIAWRTRIACPATTREFGARLFDNRHAGGGDGGCRGHRRPSRLRGRGAALSDCQCNGGAYPRRHRAAHGTAARQQPRLYSLRDRNLHG